jgi:hypothetical protein
MSDDNNAQDQNSVDDQVEQQISESTAAVTSAAASLNGTVTDPAPVGTGLTPPAVRPAEPDSGSVPQANDEKPADSAQASILSDVQKAAASVNEAKSTGADEELVEVKKQALAQLSPLVSKLDLEPEEKFETLMEIIRASDDRTLIKPAFEIAQSFEDDEKKAQALLDVVNEVNYLTQPADEVAEEPVDPLPKPVA